MVKTQVNDDDDVLDDTLNCFFNRPTLKALVLMSYVLAIAIVVPVEGRLTATGDGSSTSRAGSKAEQINEVERNGANESMLLGSDVSLDNHLIVNSIMKIAQTPIGKKHCRFQELNSKPNGQLTNNSTPKIFIHTFFRWFKDNLTRIIQRINKISDCFGDSSDKTQPLIVEKETKEGETILRQSENEFSRENSIVATGYEVSTHNQDYPHQGVVPKPQAGSHDGRSNLLNQKEEERGSPLERWIQAEEHMTAQQITIRSPQDLDSINKTEDTLVIMEREKIPNEQMSLMIYKHMNYFLKTNELIKRDDRENVYRALSQLRYHDQEKHHIIKRDIIDGIRSRPEVFHKYKITLENQAEYPDHRLLVDHILYGEISQNGLNGVIFHGFSKVHHLQFSVLPLKILSSSILSAHYCPLGRVHTQSLDHGGLVLEDGNYEIFGTFDSLLLTKIPTQLKASINPDQPGHSKIVRRPIGEEHKYRLKAGRRGNLFGTKGYIKRDENNVYRAMAHLKYHDQEKHPLIKKDLMEYIERRPYLFEKHRLKAIQSADVYRQSIHINGIHYGKISRSGTKGVLFDAFAQSHRLPFSVYQKQLLLPVQSPDSIKKAEATFHSAGTGHPLGLQCGGLIVDVHDDDDGHDHENYQIFGGPDSLLLTEIKSTSVDSC